MARARKRSAAVTLVLAGTLSGCGEPQSQRDVYRSWADCQRDWPGANQCEPAPAGNSQGHSTSWYYGPRYYGSAYPSGTPRASPNALEAFHAGRGGVARGGFGSTSSYFSGGG